MIAKFFADNGGATAIEYGLIAALVALLIISVLLSINDSMIDMFNYIESNITPALSQ
ncbi:Flp family type IVb pilin [Pelagibacterium lentulum]|uniref:Flp family type IVb pilin n=1 Tax=Pelagibacterium lentulum TaxID=2029865 RepID=A0A916R764_9HYPH|nr:Flp family type IVb pilin [Pelagibacterium lentulum]GGA39379.1 hypothetical protein GCM10011499_06030 [Pelagibacterium lentulum]